MQLSRPILGVTLAGLLLLASCGGNRDELPVAKIKDRVITLAEFERAYTTVSPQYLPETRDLAGLKEFLEGLINKELLALKADELGYDKDEFVVEGMKAFKQVGLQAGYLKVKVANQLEVTDDDLKKAYKLYGAVARVKQILTDTEEEGYEVYDMLQQGMDFENVCKQYSKGPDASQGGRVVSVEYGMFPPHLQDEVFSTKVGGYTKPIINRYGYFVMKVISKKQPPPKPFEQLKPELGKMVFHEKQRRGSFELSKRIRDKYEFRWYDENLKIVFDAMPPDRGLDQPPDRNAEVYPLLDFRAEDLPRVVASYKDKEITIKDFSDLYDRANFYQRPRREYRLGDLRKFLVDYVMNELIEEELESSGIENEPEVARMLQRKHEQLMVDRLYAELIDKQTRVGSDEMETYYHDNRDLFHRDEERRFALIITGDRSSIMEASEELKAGGHFGRVARKYSEEAMVELSGASDRLVTKKETTDAALVDHGFSLANIGDVSEPFEMSQGWAIVKLMERNPPRTRSLAEARHDINHRLKMIKNDERLNELLTKWRDEAAVEIYDKNLRKAKLDVRPPAQRAY